MGHVGSLSPLDLKSRVLVKGKVKSPAKKERRRSSGRRFSWMLMGASNTCSRRSTCASSDRSSDLERGSERGSTAEGLTPLKRILSINYFVASFSKEARDSRQSTRESRRSERDSTRVDDDADASLAGRMATARSELYGRAASRDSNSHSKAEATDAFYASCLCFRSLPVTAFTSGAPPKWALPITSVSEDRLLKMLGLSHLERYEIESLSTVKVRGGAGLTEEQLTQRAVARLAADPPPGVAKMQRRTSAWACRPCKSCDLICHP